MVENTNIIKNLSENILVLRKKRGLTQEALAKISDIPRSTITHLESGGANPSITVVSKLAGALKVSIEELLTTPRGSYKLIKADEVPKEEKISGKVKVYKLLPDHIRGMEIDRLELAANARMKGVPHISHTKEYLTCIKGKVNVYTDGQKFEVETGDVLAFPGDQPHSYHNTSVEPCICLSVVSLAFEGNKIR